ncbi:MAG: nucleotidyltransferase family protein [Acidobacteria bacterium]|nr:nucleotidyltransferase family protein [Acidobacteriota bacterium]
MLAAVILAAGESRRMGTPKALLPFPAGTVATEGITTFVEHLTSIAQHPRIGVRRVVLGAHAEEVRRHVQMAADDVVVNADWASGQLSSIQAAIRSLPPGGTDGLMLFLVDHPLITRALVGTLVERFYATGRRIVIPTYNAKRGHPVIFASSLYEELLAAPEDQGARAVVWAHAKEVLEIPTDEEGVVLNLNDPETMKRTFPA